MIESFSGLCEEHNISYEEYGKNLIVQKWNWDYADCLQFQKKVQKLIQENRSYKVFIICNHPHCFTLGRGNERGNTELLEFDKNLNLKYELFHIHRGGGVTFHYPGQWIFYPIVSINQNYTLDDHMCWVLKSAKENLEESFGIENLLTAKKLMGVWHQKKKLASIGVGVDRFVTEHGLALNLNFDQDMFEELIKINPCGMDGNTYACVDQLVSEDNLLEKFTHSFKEKFLLK